MYTPEDVYRPRSKPSWLLLLFPLVAILLIAVVMQPNSFSLAKMSSLNTDFAPPDFSGAQNGPLNVFTGPTVTAHQVQQILCTHGSPACPYAQQLYNLGVQPKYHINPAIALGFFWVESQFGTTGVARYSKSLGNIRCKKTGYCYYKSWIDGFVDFYRLLSSSLYKGDGRVTVEAIVPRYAPGADKNDPPVYIATVKACVKLWQSGSIAVP